MMLPIFNKQGSKNCFESLGFHSVPTKIDPLSEVDEKNIFEMLAEVLNETFMMDLALELDVSRECEDDTGAALDSALAGKRIVVVGASHATRQASALEDIGVKIIDISVPGWKVSAEAVEAMKAELEAVLSENFDGETIIVYQLMIIICISPATLTASPRCRSSWRITTTTSWAGLCFWIETALRSCSKYATTPESWPQPYKDTVYPADALCA
jgi:hypothetical protein